jgi:ATP-dependent RNA helicase DeaD
MHKLPFNQLGLPEELLKAVAHVGYEEASPIQTAAIPPLLAGRDVVGKSATGSGKTAAFALPAIAKVDAARRVPQVLILCPTRELAVQVAEEVARLAAFKRGVRELPIYGGASYERQFAGLKAGAQIIIGTPGRIIDHLDRKSLKLDDISMVVLDEADRMLDMGFAEDMERILAAAPPTKQTVLFSATLPPIIKRMIERFTRTPEYVNIVDTAMTAPAIEQSYYEVDRRSKLEALCRLIDIQDLKSGIIFCATKMMCDELTEHLTARGYNADKLHGDLAQGLRSRVMKRFRESQIEFLVATDVAARGLDVENVQVIFNYDLPQDAEDYVHRIGRTGRAGKSGRAITFVAGRELWKLEQIMRVTKTRVRRAVLPTLSEVEEKRNSAVLESVRTVLETGKFIKRDSQLDMLLESGHSATDIASALWHLMEGETTRPAQKIMEDDPRRSADPRQHDGPRKPYPKYAPRGREARPYAKKHDPGAPYRKDRQRPEQGY